MGDLNLDFDMGTKSVSLSDTLSDNLGFSKSESDLNLDLTTDNTKPSLNISDGVELLRVSSNNVSSSFIVPSARIANVNFVSGNVIAGNNTNLRFVPQQGGVSINKDYSNADSSTMLHIKGGGATSATTSLLVQNNAGGSIFSVRDDGALLFNHVKRGEFYNIKREFLNLSRWFRANKLKLNI